MSIAAYLRLNRVKQYYRHNPYASDRESRLLLENLSCYSLLPSVYNYLCDQERHLAQCNSELSHQFRLHQEVYLIFPQEAPPAHAREEVAPAAAKVGAECRRLLEGSALCARARAERVRPLGARDHLLPG